VRDAGSDGLTLSEFTRAFQELDLTDRRKKLETLADAGKIHRFFRTTTGRPAQFLVHADHLAEYRKKHQTETLGSV